MESKKKYRKVDCIYCESRTTVVDGVVLYGPNHKLSKKKFYYCEPCKAWVGMHEGSNKPFGSVANASLRKRRLETHKVFDEFWINSKNPNYERKAAYAWLASKMNLAESDCHIGMFNDDQCKIAIRFCLIRKKSAYK